MKQQMQLPTSDKVKGYFPNHRIENVDKFFLLVQCVIRCRTVCLNKVKSEVGLIKGVKDLNLNSIYTSLIRFFKIKKTDEFCIGVFRLLLGLLDLTGRSHYLAMDRTNWKIGGTDVNILTLGLVLENGIFIPILWQNLEKRGNSSTAERNALMERLIAAWGDTNAKGLVLLADREFVGRAWFKKLVALGFLFTVRLRKDEYWAELADAMGKDILWVQKKIKRELRGKGFFSQKVVINGVECYYNAFKSKATRGKEELLILLTTEPDAMKSAEEYSTRWGIEVFFYHTKTNGINLEDLNLKSSEKIHLMVCIAAVAYVLSLKKGVEVERQKPCKMKVFKNKTVRAKSIFRTGFDEIKNSIHGWEDFTAFISNLLCTNIQRNIKPEKSV
jgi:hypothetical protein